jgi:hypothetical protein
MSLLDRILSFEEEPASLSRILSNYLVVNQDFIMSYLTEYDNDSVKMWADDNMMSIADMLDVIQRNLDSKVKLIIKCDDYMNNRLLINSKLILTDCDRSYSLSLVWYLGE